MPVQLLFILVMNDHYLGNGTSISHQIVQLMQQWPIDFINIKCSLADRGIIVFLMASLIRD